MPPAPQKRHETDALAASGRALALAICVALAGCQSNAVRDDTLEQTRRAVVPAAQEPIWLSDTATEVEHQDIWERIATATSCRSIWTATPASNSSVSSSPAAPDPPEIASGAAAYIHYIVERLEERDMPLELALLPIISSYDPFAYSPAHAVRLWQFIPSTGRHFNLRQTSWYDGRRDITASTNAAALSELSAWAVQR